MTAAVLAHGVTTIENAAREPDLVDLGEFLIAMGAQIEGLGSPVITITGVKELTPAHHVTVTDRIIAGEWNYYYKLRYLSGCDFGGWL
jgi:UDP-N-acetylglucosamine 1-carboxyvinyltransferase